MISVVDAMVCIQVFPLRTKAYIPPAAGHEALSWIYLHDLASDKRHLNLDHTLFLREGPIQPVVNWPLKNKTQLSHLNLW